jgi:hypothetical protein
MRELIELERFEIEVLDRRNSGRFLLGAFYEAVNFFFDRWTLFM